MPPWFLCLWLEGSCISLSINQAVGEQVRESVTKSLGQYIRQAASQSVNCSIHQSHKRAVIINLMLSQWLSNVFVLQCLSQKMK